MQSKQYIVCKALISFCCCLSLCIHLLFSLLIQYEQLHSVPGRGGFLYHRFTELKIGSSEHKNAFDRGGLGADAVAPGAWCLKQGRSGGFCLKSSTTETECAMMNTLLKGNACMMKMWASAWFRFILCDVFFANEIASIYREWVSPKAALFSKTFQ